MDPNANIDEQLDLMKRIQAIADATRADGFFTDDQRANLISMGLRLAELVEALDGWLNGGGFLPERWHDSAARTHDALEFGRPLTTEKDR